MKLLLYVNPRTALANGSAESGPIDYLVDAELAEKLASANLAELASRFVPLGKNTPAPDVHRLACAAASDDAVLDALGVLAQQVEMAQRWAERVISLRKSGELTQEHAPPYIMRLWDKYPHALYRELLGPAVARALGQS